MAFASAILPLPHAYRFALRRAFPCGSRTGFPCSVSVTDEWVRRALSTGSVDAHDKEHGSPCAPYVAMLAQASSILGLLSVTMFIKRSPGFALPSILAPSPS